MFRKLFKGRSESGRKLGADDVRQLVRQFLGEWAPFRDRYAHVGEISVEWVKDRESKGKWMASVTPAIDVRCGLVIGDELGQVIEARIVAMRRGAVLAEWHR